MSSTYYLDDFFVDKLRDMVRWYDATIGGLNDSDKPDQLANTIVPFELHAESEQISDNIRTAKGKEIFFNGESGFDMNDRLNDVEADIYFPLMKSPMFSEGSRAFCIWRGRWEVLSLEPSVLEAVVVEAIPQSSDTRAEIPDGMGRIRLPNKTYVDQDGKPIPFDRCCNLYLAETEKCVVGQQVKIEGPISAENPAFDPNQDESEQNPKRIVFYRVINWDQDWYAVVSEDLYGGKSTVVEISDATGDEPTMHEMTVWNDLAGETDWIATGTPIRFRGKAGTNGIRLVMVGDVCQNK